MGCTPVVSDTLALSPGGVILCSASLELTQNDVDEGSISSVAFARGEASDGQAVLSEDTVDHELGQTADLSVGALRACSTKTCSFHAEAIDMMGTGVGLWP